MSNRYIYRVNADRVDCTGGLRVEPGAVAAICIPAGKTLNATGRNADSKPPAGGEFPPGATAGIEVPFGSTLVIFGGGRIVAQGGNGADGANGGNGGAPTCNGRGKKEGLRGGAGGNGGCGGGGAAAGIGGNGGSGGRGLRGGPATSFLSTLHGDRLKCVANGGIAEGHTPDAYRDGSGKNAGMIYILGPTSVQAKGGSQGAKGGNGGRQWRKGPNDSDYPGDTLARVVPAYFYYYTGGAGGGGGGSGGAAPADIGGGGGGGIGGGGGGGGGVYYSGIWLIGTQGGGGNAAVSGKEGEKYPTGKYVGYKYKDSSMDEGKGGVGSAPRGAIINGTLSNLYKAEKATITGRVQNKVEPSETQENLIFTYTFDSSAIPEQNCFYGERITQTVAPPSRTGFVFMGFFTDRDGKGRIEYDSQGGPLNVFLYTNDTVLFPYFINARDFKPTGVFINGVDAAFRVGQGWTYSPGDGVITLMSEGEATANREYALNGSNTDGTVRKIVLKGSGTVRFQGLEIVSPATEARALGDNEGLFQVEGGVTATVEVSGSNVLWRTSGAGSGLLCNGKATLQDGATSGGILIARGAGTSPGIGIGGSGGLNVDGCRISASSAQGTGCRVTGGGLYRQTAGTVQMRGGEAVADLDGTARIVGGSLFLAKGRRTKGLTPDNVNTKLHCIRVAVPDSPGDDVPVTVVNAHSTTGQTGYGTKGIYPIDGRIYLWRPDNEYYEFTVDGATAYAVVADADTDAYYVLTGVTIDGANVGMGLGDGWRWSPATSNLVFRQGYTNTMTVSGIDTNGSIHTVVGFDMHLRFRDLTLFGWGVEDGVVDVTNGTLTLTLEGTNVIAGLDGFRGNGLAIHPNAALTIDGGGLLSVTGGVWGAGIGGVWGTGWDGAASRAGTIDIRSGTVTAVGGFEGAGIGGASGVSGGAVNVAAGARVTARGGFGAAGVGGGAWSDPEKGGGTLSGAVTAYGGAHAPPVGAGMDDCGRTTTPTAESRAGSLMVSDRTDAALRAAVAAANAAGGGTITFASDVSGTLNLSGRLVVDAAGEVTIDGDGRIRLTGGSADSAGGGAILSMRGALSLKGLEFAGFSTAGCGGAVRAEAGLSAADCTFSGCRAGEYGGAAYVGKAAAAEFANCRFTGNAAELSGGAVYARRRLTAVRCTFDGNSATNGGAAVGAFVPDDMAIAEHCSFLSNAASRRGGGLDVGAGHAVAAACTLTRNRGGGLYAADNLTAASTLSTGNSTELSCCPPDAETGRHVAEFTACACSFGRAAAGTFVGDSVITGLGRDEPFQTDGALRTQKIGPTIQAYRKLTHGNKKIVQGCAVWHTPGWETLACSESVNPSVPKTTLFGHSEAAVLCSPDQINADLKDGALRVGAVMAASDGESLVVTTDKDVVDPEDGVTSLREAILYSSSPDMRKRLDGYREITFDRRLFGDDDGSLTLEATNGTFRIDGAARQVSINGGADGYALKLTGADDSARFSVVQGNDLMLENLTVCGAGAETARGAFTARNVRFEGCTGAKPSIAANDSSRLALERCTFFGNAGACVDVRGGTTGHALGCTAASNGAAGAAWLFRIGAGTRFDFANCTVADNRVGEAAIVTAAADGTCLVNCALTANGGQDLAVTGEGRFVSAYTSYGRAAAKPEDIRQTTLDGLTADNAFDGPMRTTLRYGVPQAFYRQNRKGSIRCTGAYAFHSDDWLALAAGVYRNGDQRAALRDRMDRANYVEATDIVGRAIVQGYVSRGSYATCCDEEYFEDGEIEVNTPKDFPEHLVEHDYDGLVTLREAVDFACSHPEFRDRAFDCTVRFADRFFGGRASNAVMLTRAQIDVSPGAFSNGTLRVLGRTDGGVIVDGGGSYRIWRTGATNTVELENLTLRNGIGVAADWTHTCGGALYNLGRTRAVNCVFDGCCSGWPSTALAELAGRASGGAVYTAGGANTVLERCTLRNCVAGYGGALFTAAEGAATAFASTFTGNRAAEGALVLSPYGGAVASDGCARTSLVNCTITGNESDGTAGGVAGLGTPGDYTLCLLSSIITGNRARNDGQGDEDLSCAGSAKVCRTVYGRRGSRSLDATWTDTDAVGNVAPSNVFIQVSENGAAVGLDVPCDGVVQTVFPARPSDPAAMRGAYARFADNDAWYAAAVWCDKITTAPGGTLLWGSTIQGMKARSGTNFYHIDQLGRPMTAATLGSTVLSGSSYVELLRPDGSVELFTSRDEAVDAANAAVTHEPWYTPIEAGDTVRLVLNAQAAPVIGAAVDFGAADASTVSVWLEEDTVKPGLWYGLGRSETPVGPFVVEDGAWVRADADGVLHEALTAPKIGAQGFYRVIVR